MEREVSLDGNEQATALARHLWGIDFSGGTADAEEFTIIVQQGAELSEWPQAMVGTPIVFAEAGCVPPMPSSARLVPTFGEIGTDGDELVVDGQFVIETVSFSAAQNLKTTAPTYLSISTAEDIDALKESTALFATDGSLPDSLLRLNNVFEIGGFLGACSCGRGLGGDRLTVNRDGLSTSPIGRRSEGSMNAGRMGHVCASCAPAVESGAGDVSLMLAAAVLGRKLYERGSIESISGAGWWFDPVVQESSDGLRRYPLILVRTNKKECIAMNFGDQRVYRLAEDGARALEALLWLDDETALSLAGHFGADSSAFATACERVLAAVGCQRGTLPQG